MNRRMEYRAPCEDLVLTEAAIPEPPAEGAVVKVSNLTIILIVKGHSAVCH